MGKKTRFSDHFNLNRNQSQLDFVDIPMETDIPLFVDPYAIHVSSQDWLRECGNAIVEYFQLLIYEIKHRNTAIVMRLLDNFHEPNETHLGFSKGRPRGRGWGEQQAQTLYEVLKESAAIQSGDLSDLGDYEMFVPGISSDKISDLAINIVKNELLLYTEDQCKLFDIPTQNVNSGRYWDRGRKNFATRYANLPVYGGAPIMLVPKTAVRIRLIPDHDKFYSRFVLDYLEAELISANHSLVTVLKNGRKKVLRRDLREEYPYSREELFKFSKRHPEILKQYKESLPAQAGTLSNQEIEERQKYPREIVDSDPKAELSAIRPGPAAADKYHSTILGLLTTLFYPSLVNPKKEAPLNEGRKRIDIRFDNASESGFFSHLVNTHRFHAPYIFVECKNYSEDPENPELDQLRGRFGRRRGNVGFLICRKLDNPQLMLKRCKDVVNESEALIMVLDDEDIVEMFRLRRARGGAGVSEHLQRRLTEILM